MDERELEHLMASLLAGGGGEDDFTDSAEVGDDGAGGISYFPLAGNRTRRAPPTDDTLASIDWARLHEPGVASSRTVANAIQRLQQTLMTAADAPSTRDTAHKVLHGVDSKGKGKKPKGKKGKKGKGKGKAATSSGVAAASVTPAQAMLRLAPALGEAGLVAGTALSVLGTLPGALPPETRDAWILTKLVREGNALEWLRAAFVHPVRLLARHDDGDGPGAKAGGAERLASWPHAMGLNTQASVFINALLHSRPRDTTSPSVLVGQPVGPNPTVVTSSVDSDAAAGSGSSSAADTSVAELAQWVTRTSASGDVDPEMMEEPLEVAEHLAALHCDNTERCRYHHQWLVRTLCGTSLVRARLGSVLRQMDNAPYDFQRGMFGNCAQRIPGRKPAFRMYMQRYTMMLEHHVHDMLRGVVITSFDRPRERIALVSCAPALTAALALKVRGNVELEAWAMADDEAPLMAAESVAMLCAAPMFEVLPQVQGVYEPKKETVVAWRREAREVMGDGPPLTDAELAGVSMTLLRAVDWDDAPLDPATDLEPRGIYAGRHALSALSAMVDVGTSAASDSDTVDASDVTIAVSGAGSGSGAGDSGDSGSGSGPSGSSTSQRCLLTPGMAMRACEFLDIRSAVAVAAACREFNARLFGNVNVGAAGAGCDPDFNRTGALLWSSIIAHEVAESQVPVMLVQGVATSICDSLPHMTRGVEAADDEDEDVITQDEYMAVLLPAMNFVEENEFNEWRASAAARDAEETAVAAPSDTDVDGGGAKTESGPDAAGAGADASGAAAAATASAAASAAATTVAAPAALTTPRVTRPDAKTIGKRAYLVAPTSLLRIRGTPPLPVEALLARGVFDGHFEAVHMWGVRGTATGGTADSFDDWDLDTTWGDTSSEGRHPLFFRLPMYWMRTVAESQAVAAVTDRPYYGAGVADYSDEDEYASPTREDVAEAALRDHRPQRVVSLAVQCLEKAARRAAAQLTALAQLTMHPDIARNVAAEGVMRHRCVERCSHAGSAEDHDHLLRPEANHVPMECAAGSPAAATAAGGASGGSDAPGPGGGDGDGDGDVRAPRAPACEWQSHLCSTLALLLKHVLVDTLRDVDRPAVAWFGMNPDKITTRQADGIVHICAIMPPPLYPADVPTADMSEAEVDRAWSDCQRFIATQRMRCWMESGADHIQARRYMADDAPEETFLWSAGAVDAAIICVDNLAAAGVEVPLHNTVRRVLPPYRRFRAALHKVRGNASFAMGDFITAASSYTVGLLMRPADSKTVVGLVGNRSETWWKMERPAWALRDASTAVTLSEAAKGKWAAAMVTKNRARVTRAAAAVEVARRGGGGGAAS